LEEKMDKAISVAVGAAAAAVALGGLFLAARSVDAGIEFFGFSLFLFGTGMNFWLIKLHFDRLERHDYSGVQRPEP
jgi:hypothetical protein